MAGENKYIYFIVRKEKDLFVLGMYIRKDSVRHDLDFYHYCEFDEIVFKWEKEPDKKVVNDIYSAVIHSMERYNITALSVSYRNKNHYDLIFDDITGIWED